MLTYRNKFYEMYMLGDPGINTDEVLKTLAVDIEKVNYEIAKAIKNTLFDDATNLTRVEDLIMSAAYSDNPLSLEELNEIVEIIIDKSLLPDQLRRVADLEESLEVYTIEYKKSILCEIIRHKIRKGDHPSEIACFIDMARAYITPTDALIFIMKACLNYKNFENFDNVYRLARNALIMIPNLQVFNNGIVIEN